MAFHDPKNFLRIAKGLIDRRYQTIAGLQTRIRTSIGRAYYAAFLLSKMKQEARGHSFRDPKKVHQLVINSFKDDHLSNIASKLDRLRDFRRDADYHMRFTFSNVDGNKCVRLAENILTLLEGI